MTAKEIQLNFIKNHLKPKLKQLGYKTAGQTWWKHKGAFYTLINLQNFSWNSSSEVDFCFNIGVVVKKHNTPQKLTSLNLNVYLRENFYLPDVRKLHKYRNKSGYTLTDRADENDFVAELRTDFEQYILPYLEKLQTLDDCLECFGEVGFWGENLRKAIEIRQSPN